MLNTIIEASENFCIHQIRKPYVLHDTIQTQKILIAYIDINTTDAKKHRVYLGSDTNFMQRIAKIFLEEDESDEETLIDMALETANLIVGSAKVIAEESSVDTYTIGTPNFEKHDFFDCEYDQIQYIEIDNDILLVAIKELN